MSEKLTRTIGVGEILTILAFCVGIIVWAIRLEGAVAANERELALIKERQTENVQHLREDLTYIRDRIDVIVEHAGDAPRRRGTMVGGGSDRDYLPGDFK